MDWLKELIEKHIKDGVLDQEELMKDINKEFPNHAVPKTKYNTLSEAKTKLEKDIKDRDAQLEDLKKVDAEGLQAEIERLQGENKTATEKYESDLKDLQLTNAIKLALNGKVHDEDLVLQLIKKESLVVGEGDKIVGLDDQLATLQESKAFLFKEKEEPKNNPSSFLPKGFIPADSVDKDKPSESIGEYLATVRSSETKTEDPWG